MRGINTSREYKNVKLILERDEFKRQVRLIREKWNIPSEGFSTSRAEHTYWERIKTNEATNGSSTYSLFLEDVKNACKELKLPAHWTYFLSVFVKTGQPAQEFNARSGRSHYSPRITTVDTDTIHLKIFSNTSLTDMRKYWPTVKKIQRGLPGYDKSRKRRRLERDLILDELAKESENFKRAYINSDEKLSDQDRELNMSTAQQAVRRLRKIKHGQ